MDVPSARPGEAAGNEIDRPVASEPSERVWGSDAIAAMLRELDIPYIALNPGASYRGLHDSIVNYLGNRARRCCSACTRKRGRDRARLCQGDRPADRRRVHANVGLMHATMAIFNAWCDRVPMLVLGATGAGDAGGAGRGSTGSTRRATRARWCATTRNGTTSRPRSARRWKPFCAPM